MIVLALFLISWIFFRMLWSFAGSGTLTSLSAVSSEEWMEANRQSPFS